MESGATIADSKDVRLAPDGSAVVIKADAVIGDQRAVLELAITTDIAPKMAVALLATTAEARASRDGLAPALEVLAAAVVASGCAEKVRMHMVFEQGVVLPVEINVDAAAAFHASFTDELGGTFPTS
jgi:hypothetical protein